MVCGKHISLIALFFKYRYQAQDFSGSIVNELSTVKAPRPAFTQLYNQLNHNWIHKMPPPKVSPVAAKVECCLVILHHLLIGESFYVGGECAERKETV
jgi:hypothetical protein